jgi:hypothetical protein
MSSNQVEKSLPLAEVLRRRKTTSKAAENNDTIEKEEDIDDEIQRLEAELAESDDGSESDSDSDHGDDRPRKVTFGEDTVKEIPSNKPRRDPSEPSVICLSAVSEARIQPLPETSLPAIRRKRNSEDDGKTKKKKAKIDGLQEAVKEVLAGYVARSSERLPFYCRVCAKQYDNKEEFFEHRNAEFHKTAVAMELKVSFCRLCQKQFTSPVQLKEHLTSKPHRERLQKVRRKKPSGGGNRQWC